MAFTSIYNRSFSQFVCNFFSVYLQSYTYLEDEEDEGEYMGAPTDVAVEDADNEKPWDDDVQDEEE